MRQRTLFLLGTMALLSLAAAGAACSSNNPSGFDEPEDGGSTHPDVTQPRDSATGDQPDVRTPESDASDAGSASDASDDAPDTASPVTGGHCSAVSGPACDLVLQDCPSGKECVVAQASDGGLTTACSAVTASQHLAKGHACCPGASDNPCDPGLECIGDQSASCDGGTLPGRCSPHCCGDAGDDSVCGASDPEGIAGHCDLDVTIGDTPAFTTCTYDEVCKPFGIRPCSGNKICIVKDSSGTAGCYDPYNPDGGAPSKEGQPCVAANACADGLICLGSGAVGTCTMECLKPGSTPNFDAGALDGGPFHGGCSAGKKCNGGTITGLPTWISVCQ